MSTLHAENENVRSSEGTLKSNKPAVDYRTGVSDVLSAVSEVDGNVLKNLWTSQDDSKNECESSDDEGSLDVLDLSWISRLKAELEPER